MKRSLQRTQKILLVAGSLFMVCVTPSVLAAPTYEFNVSKPDGGKAAGRILTVSGKYDAAHQQLSFSSTIRQHQGQLANGFWLVLSDGPNPKGDVDEYAILYGDADTGYLTSYVYNGENKANSYQEQDFIGFYENTLQVTDSRNRKRRTFTFTNFDINAINDYLSETNSTWDGASFGDNVGVWFHPAVLAETAYDDEGQLTLFDIEKTSWYDVSNVATVPAPAGLVLLAKGLGILAVLRKRKRFIQKV